MTLQDATVERLALKHGRLAVREGYANGVVAVTAPDGSHFIVNEDGVPTEVQPDFSIDWSS